jgi:hypothetical protein
MVTESNAIPSINIQCKQKSFKVFLRDKIANQETTAAHGWSKLPNACRIWLTYLIQFNNQVLNKIEEEALFLLLFSCLVTIVVILMQYAKKKNIFSLLKIYLFIITFILAY